MTNAKDKTEKYQKYQKLSLVDSITTLFIGSLIGIANIIPGVSGGTFALILGIFDKMVNAINAIGLKTIIITLKLISNRFSTSSRKNFAEEMRRIDAFFLILLLIGATVTITISSFVIKYLLTNYTCPTLAFFIGLILPSIAVPFAMMEKLKFRLLWIIPGIALTLSISLFMPENETGTSNPFIAFGAGAIAISAMILPGISGSFVLLILGQYQIAIEKFTTLATGLLNYIKGSSIGYFDIESFIWLIALVLGMIVGLFLFAKLLSILLKHAKSATMGFLIGLILGSLFVLWPFKHLNEGATIEGRNGEIKADIQIATAKNRFPGTPQTVKSTLTGKQLKKAKKEEREKAKKEIPVAAGAFIIGLVGAAGLIRLGRKRKKDDSFT